MTDSRYAHIPDHPLQHVPQSTLDVARAVLADAATWKDVDSDQADPIADAVVARLAAADLIRIPPVTSISDVLNRIPHNIRVSASLAIGPTGPPVGVVTVPADTAQETVDKLRADLPDTVLVEFGSGGRSLGGHPRQRAR